MHRILFITFIPILLLVQCTDESQSKDSKERNTLLTNDIQIAENYEAKPRESDSFIVEPDTDNLDPLKSQPAARSTNFKLIDFELSGKVMRICETLHVIDKNQVSQGDSINYFFNENGNLVKKSVYGSDIGLRWTTSYTYDSSNNLIEELTISKEGGADYRVLCEYNDKMKLIKETIRSSSYVNNIYEYDSQGLLIRKKELEQNGKTRLITKYSYDKKGNIESIITTTPSGKPWSTEVYTYNDLSQFIKSIHEGEPVNCVGRNSWEYEYNRVGHVRNKKTHDLIVNYVYEYDGNFNWTKKTHYYGDKPNFMIRRHIDYFE